MFPEAVSKDATNFRIAYPDDLSEAISRYRQSDAPGTPEDRVKFYGELYCDILDFWEENSICVGIWDLRMLSAACYFLTVDG